LAEIEGEKLTDAEIKSLSLLLLGGVHLTLANTSN
jgi:cytochrome P450